MVRRFLQAVTPRRVVGWSSLAFLATFLFVMPGVCGGPGLLGMENHFTEYTGVVLAFGGLLGIVVGMLWAAINFAIRIGKSGGKVDLEADNP